MHDSAATVEARTHAWGVDGVELVDQWVSRARDHVLVHAVTARCFDHPLVGELLDAASPVPRDPAGGARAIRRYLVDIDGRDHALLVASLASAPTRRPIALARYVRMGAGRVASPCVVVEREMRGRGIATELLRDLVSVARRNGIERFRVECRAPEPAVLQLVRRLRLHPAIVWSGPAPAIELPLSREC